MIGSDLDALFRIFDALFILLDLAKEMAEVDVGQFFIGILIKDIIPQSG